jgi:hypothetical protein
MSPGAIAKGVLLLGDPVSFSHTPQHLNISSLRLCTGTHTHTPTFYTTAAMMPSKRKTTEPTEDSETKNLSKNDSSTSSSEEEMPKKKAKEVKKKDNGDAKGDKRATEKKGDKEKLSKAEPKKETKGIVESKKEKKTDNEKDEKAKSEKGKNGDKKSKKEKDPNAPKRPKTSYQFFIDAKKDEVKASMTDGDNLMKKIGEMWKAISAEEKKVPTTARREKQTN